MTIEIGFSCGEGKGSESGSVETIEDFIVASSRFTYTWEELGGWLSVEPDSILI